jgi:predicted RNA-binding Zn ribbon-like protein
MPKVTLHDSPALIVAKCYLRGAKAVARKLVTLANADEENSVYWLDRLIAGGISKSLVADIENHLENIEIPTRIAFDSGQQKFYYKRSIPFTNPDWIPSVEAAFAFALSMVITDGLADQFRRCQLDDCGKYFLGDPRSRWCNKAHGSLHRVRKMRAQA